MTTVLRTALLLAALTALAGCDASGEKARDRSASAVTAAKVWTEPGVARSINVAMTIVSDFKPGRDILFASIPMSLGLATYGEFDTFELVGFDTSLVTHAQVLNGMGRYCREMGRTLVQTRQGVMDGQGQRPNWGWASGACR